jgi:hypothetical protein
MPGFNEKPYTFFLVVELHSNFLWTAITRTPQGMLTAIAKIGGYFSFFTFVRVALAYAHSYRFRRRLGKKGVKRYSYERLHRVVSIVKRLVKVPEIRNKVLGTSTGERIQRNESNILLRTEDEWLSSSSSEGKVHQV